MHYEDREVKEILIHDFSYSSPTNSIRCAANPLSSTLITCLVYKAHAKTKE